MSRKDILRSALSGRAAEQAVSEDASVEPRSTAPNEPSHVRSGAVGAMSRALGQIVHAADHARALVATGATVIEIPAEKIEPSFVTDRLASNGPDYDRLVDAIRSSGQRSPVLVRPHPDKPDRFQIAFGHRRVRVLAGLGRPVKAVVQSLSDDELVVIQGQENAARTDLSFIERALFARELEGRGFERALIMTSLAIDKTQLSRLLVVAHAVPSKLIKAIGPAPKAGRPRWSDLAERLANKPDFDIDGMIERTEFTEADTDERFEYAFGALAERKDRSEEPRIIADETGAKIAFARRTGTKFTVTIDDRQSPEFGDFVADQLPDLFRTFQRKRKGRKA